MTEENYYKCPECKGKGWEYYPTYGSGMITTTCKKCDGEKVLSDLQLSISQYNMKWWNNTLQKWE